MKATFPLFTSHLDLAHHWWKSLVGPFDIVLDMTCGNGHDTAFLAELKPKKLIAIDIQPQALERAQQLVPTGAEFILFDHGEYPKTLKNESVKLAVYNLGWLPGSDKSCTTETGTTLKSLFLMLPKIAREGCISITCYPGHPEGKKEEDALLDALKKLDPKEWSVCHHRWFNRSLSPSLILLQRPRLTVKAQG